MSIKVVPLGAGQDVGKSCILVTLGQRRIMFDCGMHMGYNDERRFPDFNYISKTGNFTEAIDAVIITHFHLDHCGALPYFTEVCGYNGPILMTYPTKALLPLMLEDYRKVMVERKGEIEQFNSQHIRQCLRKVSVLDQKQTVRVGSDIEIRAYYAGHVIGASMFYVKVNGESVVYTGDYNLTPDRHMGSASIDRLRPDLLITESTYATTIRDSKRAREREFLNAVHSCVSRSGKVLIPVFALGRAQELCILLDEFWEQMNLKVPIYFSAGLTAKANLYYKLFINWTNEKVKDSYISRNTFDFKHVQPFDRASIDQVGACVLFATPGMLHGGLSLEVFKHWASSELNMVVLPGYCVSGTVGHKLMGGKLSRVDVDKRTSVDVRIKVHQLSFTAHVDAKGILRMIHQLEPRHVMLVHGEKPKMFVLQSKILRELHLPCSVPANGEMVEIPSKGSVELNVTRSLVKRLVESAAETMLQRIPVSSQLNFPRKGVVEMNSASIQPKLQEKEDSLMESKSAIVGKADGGETVAKKVGKKEVDRRVLNGSNVNEGGCKSRTGVDGKETLDSCFPSSKIRLGDGKEKSCYERMAEPSEAAHKGDGDHENDGGIHNRSVPESLPWTWSHSQSQSKGGCVEGAARSIEGVAKSVDGALEALSVPKPIKEIWIDGVVIGGGDESVISGRNGRTKSTLVSLEDTASIFNLSKHEVSLSCHHCIYIYPDQDMGRTTCHVDDKERNTMKEGIPVAVSHGKSGGVTEQEETEQHEKERRRQDSQWSTDCQAAAVAVGVAFVDAQPSVGQGESREMESGEVKEDWVPSAHGGCLKRTREEETLGGTVDGKQLCKSKEIDEEREQSSLGAPKKRWRHAALAYLDSSEETTNENVKSPVDHGIINLSPHQKMAGKEMSSNLQTDTAHNPDVDDGDGDGDGIKGQVGGYGGLASAKEPIYGSRDDRSGESVDLGIPATVGIVTDTKTSAGAEIRHDIRGEEEKDDEDEKTRKKEAMEKIKGEAGGGVRVDPEHILYCAYAELIKWFGVGFLRVEDGCLIAESFLARVVRPDEPDECDRVPVGENGGNENEESKEVEEGEVGESMVGSDRMLVGRWECRWNYADDHLATRMINVLKGLRLTLSDLQ